MSDVIERQNYISLELLKTKWRSFTPEQRFYDRIDINLDRECWIWMGRKVGMGYGKLDILQKEYLAHRVSWVLHFGEIEDGLCVLHKCDNPSCVNPHHLFLGTYSDNNWDMSNKGRHAKGKGGPKGSECKWSKLTEDQVKEIRQKHKPWEYSYSKLSKEYGVHIQVIAAIISRRTWKHV